MIPHPLWHAIRACCFAALAGMIALLGARPAAGEDGAQRPRRRADVRLELFDGKPKLFVVNGYSTSFAWPRILQRKLDRYFDGQRVIRVEKAIKGSTPIAKWIDVETGRPRRPWHQVLQPELRRDEGPKIVLAQQSLQWVYGERREGIRSPEDWPRIKKGADAVETYTRALLEDGADLVFIAMHIHQYRMEPQIGHERLALTEFLKRQVPCVHAGPDVWKATKRHFPEAFKYPGRHPSELGSEIMAQKWFETLLRHDGRKAPEWSRKELAETLLAPQGKTEERTSESGQLDRSPDRIDWRKASELRRKKLRGGELTKEEQAYLARAKELRRERRQGRRRNGQPEPKPSIGLVPLTDMTSKQRYKGEDGGLYGDGRNSPPKEHLQAAMRAARQIQPLNAQGEPSPDGRIVLISNGMSNTTQAFRAFMRLARGDEDVSASVTIVDGAQGGMEASRWADPETTVRRGRPNPWDTLQQRLKRAGVTAQQVQVVWILQARARPEALGKFPEHAKKLKSDLVTILQEHKRRFPNLRLAYLSSRIYAGYATTILNPEPYAYESAFSVRWLIQDQIRGKSGLNYDPNSGKAKVPIRLWGPYLWADGAKGRKIDGLVWQRDDLAGDGTHPSRSGRKKVARLLLRFFKTDPTAKVWFVDAESK